MLGSYSEIPNRPYTRLDFTVLGSFPICFSNGELPFSSYSPFAQLKLPTVQICPLLGLFANSFASVRLSFLLTVRFFHFPYDLVLSILYVLSLQNWANASFTKTVPGSDLFFLGLHIAQYIASKRLFFSSLGGVKTSRQASLRNDQSIPVYISFLAF